MDIRESNARKSEFYRNWDKRQRDNSINLRRVMVRAHDQYRGDMKNRERDLRRGYWVSPEAPSFARTLKWSWAVEKNLGKPDNSAEVLRIMGKLD